MAQPASSQRADSGSSHGVLPRMQGAIEAISRRWGRSSHYGPLPSMQRAIGIGSRRWRRRISSSHTMTRSVRSGTMTTAGSARLFPPKNLWAN